MSDAALPIPNTIHFVWDDNFLPYSAYLAMKSAAVQCPWATVQLYKTPDLDEVPNFRRLCDELGGRLRPINVDLPAWLEAAGLPCSAELQQGYDFLKQRNYYASVSDLLRALRLYLDGGVYLDTDTLTLRDLSPVRAADGFLAEEHILVSSRVWRRNSRWRYFRTSPLTLARDACARLPGGVGWFARISGFYVRAVHNAVMGFRPRHPLMRDLLLRIAEKYPGVPRRRPLLGPDALQDLIAEKTYDGVVVHPPHRFSPLGPVMTYQYFRRRSAKRIEALRQQVVRDDTWAIHWSKNGTLARLIPQQDTDLLALEREQLFARLAVPATGLATGLATDMRAAADPA